MCEEDQPPVWQVDNMPSQGKERGSSLTKGQRGERKGGSSLTKGQCQQPAEERERSHPNLAKEQLADGREGGETPLLGIGAKCHYHNLAKMS